MSRLIDADALINDFQEEMKTLNTEYARIVFLLIIGIIAKQPTAYDIEKVMAELEHEADLQNYLRENASARCNDAQAHIHWYAEQCYRNKAIEIVRKGGAK